MFTEFIKDMKSEKKNMFSITFIEPIKPMHVTKNDSIHEYHAIHEIQELINFTQCCWIKIMTVRKQFKINRKQNCMHGLTAFATYAFALKRILLEEKGK